MFGNELYDWYFKKESELFRNGDETAATNFYSVGIETWAKGISFWNYILYMNNVDAR